jgi:tRNA pseudouridine38-40 synthase
MSNFKLLVQYDGARYDGWQRMGKDESDNTVCAKIAEVLRRMTGAEPQISCGCRTEKGVHAKGQVVSAKLDVSSPQELKNYLNRYLPRDIAVIKCETADERFHAALNAKAATYLYRIDVGNVADVFERKYSYHTFDKPDLEAMKRAASYFVGSHDFKSFTTAKKSKSTVRNVEDIEIVQDGNIVTIKIKADDFMHNMARLMVGMLLDVGGGLKKPESVKNALEGKEEAMSFPAEACGLFLESVEY